MDVSGNIDYEWAITLNRLCLRLLGIWPEINQTAQKKMITDLRVIIILNTVIWSSFIPSLHCLIRTWGEIKSMIDNLQYSLPLLIAVMKLTLMWRKKEALVSVLQTVKQDWIKRKTEKERAVMINRAQTVRKIIIFANIILLVSLILVIILPTFGVSMRYLTNITDPGKITPLQTYYLYNINNSPFYEITYILQSFSLIAAAAMYTGTDTFLGFLVFHVCGQLENLKARIFNIDKFNDFRDNLSSIIRDHIRLIRFIKTIDDTFNLMLLGLLVYFGILFALYGFLFVTILTQGRGLSIPRLSFMLMAFVITFTHMGLYCIVGEFLIIQCDGIYEAACQCTWYNMKPRQSKNLLTIIMQANRPLYITAGKLFPMTMATFCNLLKTSGGYISVLLAHRD